jgi:hypothetical protein
MLAIALSAEAVPPIASHPFPAGRSPGPPPSRQDTSIPSSGAVGRAWVLYPVVGPPGLLR